MPKAKVIHHRKKQKKIVIERGRKSGLYHPEQVVNRQENPIFNIYYPYQYASSQPSQPLPPPPDQPIFTPPPSLPPPYTSIPPPPTENPAIQNPTLPTYESKGPVTQPPITFPPAGNTTPQGQPLPPTTEEPSGPYGEAVTQPSDTRPKESPILGGIFAGITALGSALAGLAAFYGKPIEDLTAAELLYKAPQALTFDQLMEALQDLQHQMFTTSNPEIYAQLEKQMELIDNALNTYHNVPLPEGVEPWDIMGGIDPFADEFVVDQPFAGDPLEGTDIQMDPIDDPSNPFDQSNPFSEPNPTPRPSQPPPIQGVNGSGAASSIGSAAGAAGGAIGGAAGGSSSLGAAAGIGAIAGGAGAIAGITGGSTPSTTPPPTTTTTQPPPTTTTTQPPATTTTLPPPLPIPPTTTPTYIPPPVTSTTPLAPHLADRPPTELADASTIVMPPPAYVPPPPAPITNLGKNPAIAQPPTIGTTQPTTATQASPYSTRGDTLVSTKGGAAYRPAPAPAPPPKPPGGAKTPGTNYTTTAPKPAPAPPPPPKTVYNPVTKPGGTKGSDARAPTAKPTPAPAPPPPVKTTTQAQDAAAYYASIGGAGNIPFWAR